MSVALRDGDSVTEQPRNPNDDVRGRGRPPKEAGGGRAEHRLQVKLTEAGKERLDTLVDRVGAETAAAVVRDALRVYDILTEEVMVDNRQLLIRDEKTRETVKLRLW